ncbi:DUF2249 domain-containing protein [Halovenus salina]|uniref:DUF2249 domain-containing protein n=1 Tax=Halovenus salina TaxID=1510225 RepID=A0ABD5VWV8_9EURY|nr:DUF2249 domain-containing protein [Halovenus salina]
MLQGAFDSQEQETRRLLLTEELDVRDLPPAQRHEKIFSTYTDLAVREGFVLINDHDPKPLYHQFEAETGDGFYWEYQQRDSGEFRVLIGKNADSATTGKQSEAPF